jgi:stage II sporulation protein GA (sporulation sigma-E factor processing peptidase)
VRVVYIDSLFFINLIVNDLLLLAVSKICAIRVKKLRLVSGAMLGAAYAVIAVFPGFAFLQSFLVKLAVGMLIILCAFGGQKGLLRITLVFLAATAAFGGVVMAVALLGGEIWTGAGIYLPISFRALALSFGLSYGLLVLVFRFMMPRRGKGGFVQVDIAHGGKEVSFLALRDTGNNVRDPLTGIPTPVVDIDCVLGLFNRQTAEILVNPNGRKAVELLERLWELDPNMRFRLIPFSTVGIKSDMLLAFKPDKIALDKKMIRGMWVVISPTKLSDSGIYSALVNGDA